MSNWEVSAFVVGWLFGILTGGGLMHSFLRHVVHCEKTACRRVASDWLRVFPGIKR